LILILGFTVKEIYAQAVEALEIDGAVNSQEVDNKERIDLFTINSCTYKVLEDDKESVMYFKSDGLNDLKDIIINDEVEYNGIRFRVKYIYEKAFSNGVKTEKKIVINKNIIGFCNIEGNVVEGLTGTFLDHRKLENIDFGSISTPFREKCFQNCKALTEVDMPKDMRRIEGYTFDKCSVLKCIDLRNIMEFEGQSAFANCSRLETIGEINDELTELPDNTFLSCSNLRISNLNNIIKIGDECFKNCRVINKNVVIKVEEIGKESFYGCSFDEIYLGKARKIGSNAFGNCGALTKIRFGSPSIPQIDNKITQNSLVNEYVFPLDYRNQSDYSDFLNKLIFSKVTWHSNYGSQEKKVTQEVRADTLKPPTMNNREGYEIEGWYREPECINKINIIADLGEIVDSDLVIKNPDLYANWISKGNTEINQDDEQKTSVKEGDVNNTNNYNQNEEDENDEVINDNQNNGSEIDTRNKTNTNENIENKDLNTIPNTTNGINDENIENSYDHSIEIESPKENENTKSNSSDKVSDKNSDNESSKYSPSNERNSSYNNINITKNYEDENIISVIKLNSIYKTTDSMKNIIIRVNLKNRKVYIQEISSNFTKDNKYIEKLVREFFFNYGYYMKNNEIIKMDALKNSINYKVLRKLSYRNKENVNIFLVD